MSNIKILKNSPKLNSNGQYRFDGGGADAQNLSVSGEFNSKFLDDDLYTTSLGNTTNEDIINNDYDIQQDPSLSLTVDIKSSFDERNNTIKFTVALFDDSVLTDADNPYLSDTYVSDGQCVHFYRNDIFEYIAPAGVIEIIEDSIGDNSLENLQEALNEYFGDTFYTAEIETCNSNDFYEHYKKIVFDNKYKIWSRSDYGEKGEWDPGKIIDDAKILENFARFDDNGDYLDDFSGYANNSFDVNESLNISLSDWEGINFDEGKNFYVVVYMQGHKRRSIGTDARKKRIQVFKFDKREFKWTNVNGDECTDETPEDNPNCWLHDGTYYKGNTTEIEINKTSDMNVEGGSGGTGAKTPAFYCKSVTMKVVPPYQMDKSEWGQNDIPEIYFNNITFPKALLLANSAERWYELSPYRVINFSYLENTSFTKGSDVLDFEPVSQINTKNNNIDLQQYYVDFDDKFKSSAPGFVELNFDIKSLNYFTGELLDFADSLTQFAFFVVDWDDNNEKFKEWDDVLDDFPTSYSELYRNQQDKNTYILRGISDYGTPNTTFSPLGNLNHFYRTSGLKTIKSVVFSYAIGTNGIQALRWKLVTSRIFLNENRVTKEDFNELGTLGFTTIPWPYTTPIISGISKLSKYYDSVENTLYNNRFASDELLSETQVYNALINDELGDFIGDVDIEQTRFFSGAYDMDELLMIEEDDGVDSFTPYIDDSYWDAENNFYPDFDESCVGLIFISDSSNTTLKQNCLIELNMGDVEDTDSIVDTSGNSNIGLLIGDYTIRKESTLVPLTRDSEMKLPETDNEDKAI